MTLTMAWIRKLKNSSELIVAADSRLSGGFSMNSAPKIMALPRGDSVIAFAGDTVYAYPFMIHAYQSVFSHHKTLTRANELEVVLGHLLRVFNQILEERNNFGDKSLKHDIDFEFVFAGYCWLHRKFEMHKITYDTNLKRFIAHPGRRIVDRCENTLMVLAGDDTVGTVDEIRARLFATFGKKSSDMQFDYEPLLPLMQRIDDASVKSIGGNVQIYKVYQYLNSASVATVLNDQAHIFGRRLLNYENAPIKINLDSFKIDQL